MLFMDEQIIDPNLGCDTTHSNHNPMPQTTPNCTYTSNLLTRQMFRWAEHAWAPRPTPGHGLVPFALTRLLSLNAYTSPGPPGDLAHTYLASHPDTHLDLDPPPPPPSAPHALARRPKRHAKVEQLEQREAHEAARGEDVL